MSYAIWIQRFAHGDAAAMDDERGQEILAPYVVERKPEHGFLRIRASDGGDAAIYATPGSIMVDRFSPGGILDIIADMVQRLEAVILLPEGVAIVRSEEDRSHLPAELRADAVIIVDLCGAAILNVIGST